MLTEAHKLAISQGMRKYFDNGGIPSMLGKKNSELQKQTVSNMFKGKKLSGEHRKKLSDARLGMKFSDSHKANIKKSMAKYRGRTFKGSSSEYKCLHFWLKGKLPKLECEQCHATDKLQYANRTGLYLKDVSDYIVLCTLCHCRYDWDKKKELASDK